MACASYGVSCLCTKVSNPSVAGGEFSGVLQHPGVAVFGYLVAAWLLLLCASQVSRAMSRRSPSTNWYAPPSLGLLASHLDSGAPHNAVPSSSCSHSTALLAPSFCSAV